MKNILIAVDFDDNYQKLVNQGVQLAEKFNAKLWLLHITAPDPDFVGYGVGPQYIRDSRADEIKKEHKILVDLSEKLRAGGIDTEGIVIQGQYSRNDPGGSKKTAYRSYHHWISGSRLFV